MPYFDFVWTDPIIQHLAVHGVTPDEFEEIVGDPVRVVRSRSSNRWIAFGYSGANRYLACVYDLADFVTVIPVTAYEPRK